MIRIAAEKNFENKIKEYIEARGGWQVKFFANAYTKSGIPDILSCVNGHFLAIEVKAPNGTPSELQKHHVRKILYSGGFAVIVCPKQFEDLQYLIRYLMYGDVREAKAMCNKINAYWALERSK